mgnify:CR=1 FL=1
MSLVAVLALSLTLAMTSVEALSLEGKSRGEDMVEVSSDLWWTG